MNKIANTRELQAELRTLLALAEEPNPSRTKMASALLELADRVAGDERNFGIELDHPTYRSPKSTPFKGTLPEVKRKARELLKAQDGGGWKVTVYTDGRVIYSEHN